MKLKWLSLFILMNAAFIAPASSEVVQPSVVLPNVSNAVNAKKFKDIGLRFSMAQYLSQSFVLNGKVVAFPSLLNKEQSTLSIATADDLWVDIQLSSPQDASVAPDQTVFLRISALGEQSSVYRSLIKELAPPSKAKPYSIARVKFPPLSSKVKLSPGDKIEARIVTNEFFVDLAVEKQALQTVDNKIGVFVLENDQFQFFPLELGREGDVYVEVKSGIESKAVYVNRNPQLIKAEVDKLDALKTLQK